MDLIIDFFKLGFLIISYRRRFCFFSLHHLFFRFLETTKTSPNSLKTSINTKGYADRNFSQDHKDSHEKIKSSAKLIYCFIRRRESSKKQLQDFFVRKSTFKGGLDPSHFICECRKEADPT